MGHDRKKDMESIVPYNISFGGDNKKIYIYGDFCLFLFFFWGGDLNLLPDMFFNQGSSVSLTGYLKVVHYKVVAGIFACISLLFYIFLFDF